MLNWENYFKKHLNRKIREHLIKATSFCSKRDSALDLGSGTFIESKFLIENGFGVVVAIDNSIESKKLAQIYLNNKLDFRNISFNEYYYPKNTFNLINAQFSLPFYGKDNFTDFVDKIINSLKPEGVFVGQFFGVKDSWNVSESKLIFHTKEEVLNIFLDFEILEFEEEEKDELASDGNLKHWHIFHFIAKYKI